MTDHERRGFVLDSTAVYRIEVQGRLDPDWITDMCGMSVHHGIDEDRLSVTTLTGELVDQAALMGVLNLVYGLGYPLLSLANLSRAGSGTRE